MTTDFGQHKNIQTLLGTLGLNEMEQKIYLFGLTTPPLPVSSIAKQIGTTRPNAYNIINSLQTKGLCWNLGTQYGRKVKFAPPERLLELNQEKIKALQSLESEIKNLSKTLKNKTYSGAIIEPRIQYFQGTEGVKKLYSMGLTTKEGMVRTSVYEGLFERFGKEYVADYIKQRCEKKIKSRILYAESFAAFNKIHGPDPSNNREVRVPPKSINFDSMITIYDSRVSIITMSNEIFGTLIDSVDFSNTMRGWFDTIWKISK